MHANVGRDIDATRGGRDGAGAAADPSFTLAWRAFKLISSMSFSKQISSQIIYTIAYEDVVTKKLQ